MLLYEISEAQFPLLKRKKIKHLIKKLTEPKQRKNMKTGWVQKEQPGYINCGRMADYRLYTIRGFLKENFAIEAIL
jgi:hypothetical protein